MRKNERLIALCDLGPGSRAVVRSFLGDPLLASRLSSMGLAVGAEAEVLSNRRRGALLVRALDTRIALGREAAERIMMASDDGFPGGVTGK